MHKIHRTIDIKAPVQRVYDFVNQPTNLPSIWPNMISVSNIVPAEAGTHSFDWIFKMAGLHFNGHTNVQEAKSGILAVFRNEGAIPSTFRWTYSGRDGSATRLGLEVEYTMPLPVVGKLAEVIAVKMNERDLDTMLANLKDVMEHRSTTTAAAGAPAH